MNTKWVHKCRLRCPKQTELIYAEAPVHGDGFKRRSILLMCKILEMKKIRPFFLCLTFGVMPFIDSLLPDVFALFPT